MRYAAHTPSPDLAPFITCYWTLDGRAVSEAVEPERILPDGCFELIFNFADPFEEISPNGTCRRQPGTLLVGQLTRFMQARPTGRIDLLAVRFRPAGAGCFLAPPLDGFTNTALSGADVDPFWGRCREALGNAVPSERLGLLENRLRACFNPAASETTIDRVVLAMKQSSGNCRIDELATFVGVSPSALQRSFRRRVGIGPKILARVFRIQAALDLKQRHPEIPVGQLAHRCGYFDHAHFTRDFSSVVGQTPTEFFQSSHELSDLLTDSS